MKKLILALISIITLVSCTTETKPSIIKKETINIYEVKDTFGELKKSETPMVAIIRECNELGNITKIGYYEGDGKVVYTETYTYDENNTPIKSSKQATAMGGLMTLTENISLEDGQWFKEENGNKTLLGNNYQITGYQYKDYIEVKENGNAIFTENVMGVECDGKVNTTDKNGRWTNYTAITKSVEIPQMIFERIIELW